jgi:hypothetical protein
MVIGSSDHYGKELSVGGLSRVKIVHHEDHEGCLDA